MTHVQQVCYHLRLCILRACTQCVCKKAQLIVALLVIALPLKHINAVYDFSPYLIELLIFGTKTTCSIQNCTLQLILQRTRSQLCLQALYVLFMTVSTERDSAFLKVGLQVEEDLHA